MHSQITSTVGLIGVAKLHRAKITVTPKDKSGQNLGPGHADQIDVRVRAGQSVGPLVDELNGAYNQIIEYSSGGEKPVVSVSVGDVSSEPVPVDEQCWLCRLFRWLCDR